MPGDLGDHGFVTRYRCAIKEGMLWASGRAVGVAQIR